MEDLQIGDSALMAAVRNRDKAALALLLEQDTSNINHANSSNETALIISAGLKNNTAEILEMLLKRDNLNLHTQSYFFGTALTCAIFLKQFSNAKLLLSKEKFLQLSQHPGALYWAVKYKAFDILEIMCEKNADLNISKYSGFIAPPDWVWKSMSSKLPFQFREKDTTPIHLAIKEADTEMLGWLLEHKADPNLICDSEIPLLIAAEKDDVFSIALLLRYGADLTLKIDATKTVLSAVLDNQYISDETKEFLKEKNKSRETVVAQLQTAKDEFSRFSPC